MTTLEKKQIQRLQERKAELIDEFIGRCEEINYQIEAIKTGKWRFVEVEENADDNTRED